jgi:hypothetical protein
MSGKKGAMGFKSDDANAFSNVFIEYRGDNSSARAFEKLMK